MGCSSSHTLLATGRIDPLHPDLAFDPVGILRPATKFFHRLPLVDTTVSPHSAPTLPFYHCCVLSLFLSLALSLSLPLRRLDWFFAGQCLLGIGAEGRAGQACGSQNERALLHPLKEGLHRDSRLHLLLRLSHALSTLRLYYKFYPLSRSTTFIFPSSSRSLFISFAHIIFISLSLTFLICQRTLSRWALCWSY